MSLKLHLIRTSIIAFIFYWVNLSASAQTAVVKKFRLLLRENSNFYPIKDFCKLSTQQKIDGILCTVWDDTSPHQDGMERTELFAMLSWNYEDTKLEDANVVYRHRFHSPTLSDSSFEFQDLLEQGVTFWETALLDKGRRSNYPDATDLIDLPHADKTGSWSKKYEQRVQQAKHEIARYTVIKKRIENAQKLALRNRYSLEVMYQINKLQIYASKLLVLLDQFDRAALKEQKNALRHLVADFPGIRENMEKVYAVTRSLNKPDDYLLDKNFHRHVANGTINTDWMFVYELAINKAIGGWENKQ